ncbi:MAG: hypothetical protein ACE5GB_08625 [Acidimicrobiales bacterium]
MSDAVITSIGGDEARDDLGFGLVTAAVAVASWGAAGVIAKHIVMGGPAALAGIVRYEHAGNA